MKDIPADSLIKNYFPVDYIDSFSKVMVTGQALTPEDFRNLAFSRFPKWIGWLMNFRNAIVKPLGLDTATRFTDMVLDKNLHEEILGMPDKHLDFHVSMWCGEYHEGKQELRITTVVKYNNWLGRAYFFIIRPFHGIIVKSILKHVAGDRGSIYLSGATSNRKWVDMALSFSKLYLCYDVSPLNKVFTALHRSTQVCILGTISECKDRDLF